MIDGRETNIEGIALEEHQGIELDAGMAELIVTLLDYAEKEPATAAILGEIIQDAMARSTIQTYLASLHPKYIAFLASMLQTKNVTRSAKKAGISTRWGFELLYHHPEVMAAYQEICQIVNEELLQQAITSYITKTLLPQLMVNAVVEAQKRLERERVTPVSEQIYKLRAKSGSNGSPLSERTVKQ